MPFEFAEGWQEISKPEITMTAAPPDNCILLRTEIMDTRIVHRRR